MLINCDLLWISVYSMKTNDAVFCPLKNVRIFYMQKNVAGSGFIVKNVYFCNKITDYEV